MVGGRGGGGGGGGRGGGGGSMLRAVARAVARTRVAASSGSSTAPRHPLSSSSSSSSCSAPTSPMLAHKHVSSNPLSLSSSFFFGGKKLSNVDDDAEEWVCVDGVDGDNGRYFLGAVPSQNEVEDAVSALQKVFEPASRDQVFSDGSETDWSEPSLFPYNSTGLQTNGFDRVYYAFHLLKTDPHVQRMVRSLSSDKTVWDAVLNNEVVQEIRESFSADEEHALQSPDGTSNSDSFTSVVRKIFDTAKAIFMEIIGEMSKIVSELFQSTDHRTNADAEGLDTFNDRLRTSFVLSIMVLLIVVLNRVQARA